VPRVPERLLKSIVYVYPNEHAAETDSRFGGTAFVVAFHGVTLDDAWSQRSVPDSLYVVTAAHVVVGKGRRVLRINRGEGFVTVPVEERDWYWQEERGQPKYDLAVCPIDMPDHPSLDMYSGGAISITRALPRRPAPWHKWDVGTTF
jgi:hypothetical protein